MGRVGRLLRAVALALSALLLVVAGGGYLAYRHYLGRIGQVSGLGDLSKEHRSGSAANYLVVGTDAVDDVSDAQLRQIGVNRSQREVTRTDTILLVHLPADGSRARVVSFPRDSLVPIPGHRPNKINSAFGFGERDRPGGGAALLVATVEGLSGLHIDHYVQVSLFGFYKLTNAVGGVEVCLKQPARDDDAAIDLPAGRQVLQGKDALAFVRQRHGVPGEDLGRIRRQQYFVGALLRKVLSSRTLFDPLQLNRVLTAVGDSLQVDKGTSGRDLLELGGSMRGLQAERITFQTIPVLNPAGRAALPGQPNASVVLLDEPQLKPFFAALGDDDPSEAETATRDQVAVTVLNGTGRVGLAAAVTAELERRGFHVGQPRTAAASERTTVVHAPGEEERGRAVSALLDQPVVEVDPAVPAGTVRLVLGADYAHLRQHPTRPRATERPTTAADGGCIA